MGISEFADKKTSDNEVHLYNQGGLPILPTFYKQIFCTKVLREAFLHGQFWFILFWPKNISTKASLRKLVKCDTRCRKDFFFAFLFKILEPISHFPMLIHFLYSRSFAGTYLPRITRATCNSFSSSKHA
jgi:hypothetical protein